MAVLAVTAYLYRLTADSHSAALGLIAGLVLLLAFGDALTSALAGRVGRMVMARVGRRPAAGDVDPPS